MSVTVLIVDDSKLARMSVAKALKSLHPDWSHVEAANADEALALVKQGNVAMALLDFNMPGRDGLALAAELKTLYPDMPVAIISANHQEEIVNKAKGIGAFFLGKPVTVALLQSLLGSVGGQLKPVTT